MEQVPKAQLKQYMSHNKLMKGRKKDPIEQFISSKQIIIKSGLPQLRYMILAEGLNIPEGYETCPYRPYVWSILLRVPVMDADCYIKLVNNGPPSVYLKIRNDTFRTLTKDAQFQAKVHEDSLIRILSAFAWSQKLNQSTNSTDVGYVQGMNVLLAPIIYASKSEPQTFALFQTLLQRDIPLYVKPNLDGVHTGLQLVDVCLEIIDPVLFEFLHSKFLKAEIYAFASVLTLSACTPPLSEVLKLWDFLFAYGTHMNILFIIAQLILIRSKLLESSQPMKLLRSFPLLNSNEIIKLSISFIPKLPKKLYVYLCKHAFDESINGKLKKYLEYKKKS